VRTRLVSGVVAIAFALALAACSGGHSGRDSSPMAANDVIANLWEWPWTSVAAECTGRLGPDGYAAVQVAPPEDSLDVDKHPWWDVYQPVGYDLNSRFGTKDEFAAMVTACHAAGVKVYVDAVINHMTGGQSSTAGYGGATYTADRHFPDAGYTPGDFHAYPVDCPTSDGQISDYNDVTQVQNCNLLGLSDLRTESDHVRDAIAGYLNSMIALGVDGFRIDAAKHIPVADLAAIKAKLTKQPFWVQEVIPGVPPMADYESLGQVLEFNYARNLRGQFVTGISGLKGYGTGGVYEPSDSAVVFVTNHDTERDDSTLDYTDGSIYQLANVFMLAWNYGIPTVFSGFTFTDYDQPPPSDAKGFVKPVVCDDGWECEHRRMAGMVAFHNATHGDPTVSNWWDDGSNAIAFSRGPADRALGWVAINAGDSPTTQAFQTGLRAGTYCDLVRGKPSAGSCVGAPITVDGSGVAHVTVAPKSAVAILAAPRTAG
jgi:alpha-amylase